MLTKLPHYVLPLYPAIAILIAGALERRVLSRVLADARRGLVVRRSGWRGSVIAVDRRDHADASAGVSGLAVRWRRR